MKRAGSYLVFMSDLGVRDVESWGEAFLQGIVEASELGLTREEIVEIVRRALKDHRTRAWRFENPIQGFGYVVGFLELYNEKKRRYHIGRLETPHEIAKAFEEIRAKGLTIYEKDFEEFMKECDKNEIIGWRLRTGESDVLIAMCRRRL